MKTVTRNTAENVILGAVILLTVCIQFTFGRFLTIGNGIAPNPVLVLLIVISMQRDAIPAVIFGAVGGIATDMMSSSTDGFYAIFFVLMSFIVSELMIFKLRHTFVAALIFTVVFAFMLNIAYWFFFIFIKGYDDEIMLLTVKYLPSALYTAVFIVLYYPLSLLLKKKPLYE